MPIGLCQYTADPPGNDKEGAATCGASGAGSQGMSTADEKEKMFSPSEEGGGTDMSAQPKLSSQEPAGSNSLEKIREILFGGQMQEFQRRCDRLEERLVNIAADLRADLKKVLTRWRVLSGASSNPGTVGSRPSEMSEAKRR